MKAMKFAGIIAISMAALLALAGLSVAAESTSVIVSCGILSQITMTVNHASVSLGSALTPSATPYTSAEQTLKIVANGGYQVVTTTTPTAGKMKSAGSTDTLNNALNIDSSGTAVPDTIIIVPSNGITLPQSAAGFTYNVPTPTPTTGDTLSYLFSQLIVSADKVHSDYSITVTYTATMNA